MERILVFAATYNEADTVESLVGKITEYLPEQEILFVDDSSPDGTGELLDKLAKKNPNIHVIHRPRKMGLGTAHKLAMKYAVHQDFDILITMDADFSHHPKYLPALLETLAGRDLVIGSRYMKGGKSGYGFFRAFLSRSANVLSRMLLGLKLKECTTSYRGFRVSLLKNFNIDAIRSNGYSFFVESLYYLSLLTPDLAEFPIYFADRRAGTSKISRMEILKGVLTLGRLAFRRLFSRKFLQRKISQNDSPTRNVCMNCGSHYQTELYPARRSDHHGEEVYRCTSEAHKSHERIVECLQCGLVYSDTEMLPEAITRMYAEVKDPTYAENSEGRYKTFRYNMANIREYLPNQGRLLDVGSYCGVFLQVGREFGFETLGLEPSGWAVKYAREVLGEKVIQGTIDGLPENIERFDVITLWDVLEHLPDPLGALSILHSKLKPKGIIVFSTLDIENWFPRVMGERWPWFMDMHLYYFRKDIVEQMLKKSGFDLLSTRKYCHVVTADYLLMKLECLGIKGLKYLKFLPLFKIFKKLYVPFQLGDVQLFVAKKNEDNIFPCQITEAAVKERISLRYSL